MEKHSVTIRGHRTSISLEREFWLELKAIAEKRGRSLSHVVTRIDAERPEGQNLSSALRLHVLRELKSHQEVSGEPSVSTRP